MAFDRQRYLQPSGLCDFDRSPALRKKAAELTSGCRSNEAKFKSIFAFVKELPYGLEDWDVKASESLKKGWGMCSGKTNLLIALLRSSGIAARYRIYQFKADTALWQRLGDESGSRERLDALGEIRDHVDCEVRLGGRWIDCDPGRDSAMERGIVKLGGSLERHKVTDSKGKVRYLRLAVFDDWARERQKNRTFRADRTLVFSEINKGLDLVRELGRSK